MFHKSMKNGHRLNGRGPVWWVPWEEMSADAYRASSYDLVALIYKLRESLADLNL